MWYFFFPHLIKLVLTSTFMYMVYYIFNVNVLSGLFKWSGGLINLFTLERSLAQINRTAEGGLKSWISCKRKVSCVLAECWRCAFVFYLLCALPQERVEVWVSVQFSLIILLRLPVLDGLHQSDHLIAVLSRRHLHHWGHMITWSHSSDRTGTH